MNEPLPIARRPLALALGAQLLGLALAGIFVLITPEMRMYPLVLSGIQGSGAAIASYHLGAPRWWQAIHLIFAPAAVIGLRADIPPLSWLVAFVVLYLIFGRTFRNQVPLFLTNRHTGHAISELIPPGNRFFIDLGCGDGGLLAQLAYLRPECEFVGVEHAFLPLASAKIRTHRFGNAYIRTGDLWRVPLTPYDVCYAFLSPAPMSDIWAKACEEMRPGTLLISNSFEIPGIACERSIVVDDARQSRLYLYRIPPAGDEAVKR